MTLLPAWSSKILGGDARTYGVLVSARGLGALAGALMIAALGRKPVRGKLWTAGNLIMPATMIAFAMVHWVPLSIVIIAIAGWAFMVQVNTSNALVQTHVPDELRGRVMGIYTLVFFGGMPLGSLMAGQLATRIGEPATLILNGLLLAVFAAFVWFRLSFVRRLE